MAQENQDSYKVDPGEDIVNYTTQILDQVRIIRNAFNNPESHVFLEYRINTLYIMVLPDAPEDFIKEWEEVQREENKSELKKRFKEFKCLIKLLARWKLTVKRKLDERL